MPVRERAHSPLPAAHGRAHPGVRGRAAGGERPATVPGWQRYGGSVHDEPLDPFRDDPVDPSTDLDETGRVIEAAERGRAHATSRRISPTSRSTRRCWARPASAGLVIDCEDCREPHFFDWALLRANLRHLLDSGRPRVHEPAFDPDPDHYVSWEYARGYTDGVHDTLLDEDEEK